MSLFVSQTLKFFFLLTPFFGLSMFISMTSGYPPRERRLLALRVALAAIVIAALSAQMIMEGVRAFLK